jgi:hypothetical protein
MSLLRDPAGRCSLLSLIGRCLSVDTNVCAEQLGHHLE